MYAVWKAQNTKSTLGIKRTKRSDSNRLSVFINRWPCDCSLFSNTHTHLSLRYLRVTSTLTSCMVRQCNPPTPTPPPLPLSPHRSHQTERHPVRELSEVHFLNFIGLINWIEPNFHNLTVSLLGSALNSVLLTWFQSRWVWIRGFGIANTNSTKSLLPKYTQKAEGWTTSDRGELDSEFLSGSLCMFSASPWSLSGAVPCSRTHLYNYCTLFKRLKPATSSLTSNSTTKKLQHH